jgi:hypothetical protein
VSKVDRNQPIGTYLCYNWGGVYAYGLLISGLLSSWMMVVVVVLLFSVLLRLGGGYVSVAPSRLRVSLRLFLVL